MAVGTFNQPDHTDQDGSTYKLAINNCIAVLARQAAAFAAHEQDSPDMTVRVDTGALLVAGTLIEVAAQNSAALAVPSSNNRIDLVVIDIGTGAVAVVTGVEASSPTPPALPSGKMPACQVLLYPGMAAISNQDITDKRVTPISSVGTLGASFKISIFKVPGTFTWTRTPGCNHADFEIIGGGGGSGAPVGLTSYPDYEGGPGGAGGRAIVLGKDISAITSKTVIIGVAGTGATTIPSRNYVTDGGSSSIADIASATGGQKGQPMSTAFPNGAPGQGGVASGGDLNITGDSGTPDLGGCTLYGTRTKINESALGYGVGGNRTDADFGGGPNGLSGTGGIIIIREYP